MKRTLRYAVAEQNEIDIVNGLGKRTKETMTISRSSMMTVMGDTRTKSLSDATKSHLLRNQSQSLLGRLNPSEHHP